MENNNAPSTSTGGARGQHTGNRGVVAGTVNATNVQTGDHNIINYAPDPMAKLIDETNQQLNRYSQKEGKLFVESPAFKQCELRVTKNGLVTVFGAPGDGKTTIGFELLRRIRDRTNRKILIIANKNDWEKVDLFSSTHQKLAILFDDMFGGLVLDESLKIYWFSQLKKIFSFVQDGKIQVIITCRETIFSTAKNELECFELSNAKNIIHLSGSNCEYPLDEETQFDIIEKHIKLGGNIKICDDSKEVLSPMPGQHCCISVDTLREISRKSCVGYMQMCKVFISDSKYYSEGESFFDGVGEFLIKEINRLRDSEVQREKYNYCTLACVLVKQGLNVEQIDGDAIVGKIATSCRIESTSTLKYEINLAVKRLTSTYLIKINDEYQFQHNSWIESVFKSFLESNASLLIKYCKFGLIDLITTKNSREKSTGLYELGNDGQYLNLFQRLASEMANGNLSHVFLHRCFTDSDFTQKFRDWLESDKKRKRDVLRCGELDRDLWWRLDEFGERDDTKRSVLYWASRKSDVDFIDWVEKGLRKFGLRQSGKCDMTEEMSAALQSACYGGNLPVCTWLLSQTGIEVSDECIVAAAFSGNVDVVKTLLNLDTTFSCDNLSWGWTWACGLDHIDVCNEILTQPGVDRGSCWHMCLLVAALRGDIDLVTALLNYGQFKSDELSDSLHTACQSGHIDVFSLLLTQPGVDKGDKWDRCLRKAARREKSEGDSRFSSLLKTKGYVIPDVSNSDDSEVTDDDSEVTDDDNEVTDNDSEVKDNDSEVEDIDSEVKDSDTEVTDNDSEVKDNDSEVTDNDSEVTDNDSEVTDNDSEVKDNDSEVKDIDSEVKDNDTELTDDDNEVTDNESEVTDDDSKVTDDDSKVTDNDSEVTDDDSKVTDNDSEVVDDESKVTDDDSGVTDDDSD